MPNLELQPAVDLDLMQEIFQARDRFAEPDSPVLSTELIYDDVLSDRYGAEVWFASELHQVMRAHKIRGAANFIQSISSEEQELEVVSSSAGNHGQAIAHVASRQGLDCHVFMPENTPSIKVEGVARHGGETTRITLAGSTYDECETIARRYCDASGAVFAHPFDDRRVVAGQGTLGLEIAENLPELDAVFCPVGGGGLLAGIATALKHHNPDIDIIGVEPAGAASMQEAVRHGKPIPLEQDINTFVDGAAVRRVGDIPFAIARPLLHKLITVSNRDLRRVTTDLWSQGLPVELAAALSRGGVEQTAPTLVGKKVLYILTGGNLSQQRYETEVRIAA